MKHSLNLIEVFDAVVFFSNKQLFHFLKMRMTHRTYLAAFRKTLWITAVSEASKWGRTSVFIHFEWNRHFESNRLLDTMDAFLAGRALLKNLHSISKSFLWAKRTAEAFNNLCMHQQGKQWYSNKEYFSLLPNSEKLNTWELTQGHPLTSGNLHSYTTLPLN